ncbi:hypothetical protein AB1Y20_018391 [Prymnesium parvum]|uniref:Uncharacterized protein n=1 Tax=Prymnesium parvum TaxID=97485 RepID=A0AB34JPR6_PRYPA
MASAFRSTPASEASQRGSESVSTRHERTNAARKTTAPPRRDPSRGVNFERLPYTATALHSNSSEAHDLSTPRRSREEDQSSRSADEHAGQCAVDGSTSAPDNEATEGVHDGNDAVAARMVAREDSDVPSMPNEMPIVFQSIGENPIEIGRISFSTSADLPVLLVAVAQILCNLSPSSSELQAVLARGDPTDGTISLPKAFLAGDVRLTDAATNLPIQTNEAFKAVAGKWMRQEAARVAALLRIRVAQIEKGLKERAGPFHVMALLELWDLVADPTTISWVSDGVINSMLHVALNTETMDVLGLCVVVIWMLIVAKHQTKAHSSLHLPSEEIAHVLLWAIHRLHAMRREEGLRKNAGENGDFHSDANEMSLTDASFLNSAAFDAEFSKSFSSTAGGKGLDLMKSFGSLYGVKSMDHLMDTSKDDDSDEQDSSRAADGGTSERFDTDRFNGWFGVDYVGQTGEWRPDMFFYTGSTEPHAIQIPASKRLELASLLKPQSLLWAVSALYELLSRDRDATLLAILNGSHHADGGATVGLTQLVSLLQDEELKTCRTAIEVLRLVFTSSPEACVQLFEEWPWVFAQFIGGWSNPNVPAQVTHKGFELRCQVSLLFKLVLQRVYGALSSSSNGAISDRLRRCLPSQPLMQPMQPAGNLLVPTWNYRASWAAFELCAPRLLWLLL